eukprot:8099024-Pyramimonas_sp.AAC.1
MYNAGTPPGPPPGNPPGALLGSCWPARSKANCFANSRAFSGLLGCRLCPSWEVRGRFCAPPGGQILVPGPWGGHLGPGSGKPGIRQNSNKCFSKI